MTFSWTRVRDAFDWKKLFSAEIRHEDTVGREAAEAYDDWRRNFIRERLHVLYYLGFIANPAFIALDYLLHRVYLISLFIILVVLQLGLFIAFFSLEIVSRFFP